MFKSNYSTIIILVVAVVALFGMFLTSNTPQENISGQWFFTLLGTSSISTSLENDWSSDSNLLIEDKMGKYSYYLDLPVYQDYLLPEQRYHYVTDSATVRTNRILSKAEMNAEIDSILSQDNWGYDDLTRVSFLVDSLIEDSGVSYEVGSLLGAGMDKNKIDCDLYTSFYKSIFELHGVEANTRCGPKHAFTSVTSPSGKQYNIESTEGEIYSDYFYINEDNIDTDLIDSGLYLTDYTQDQSKAVALIELANTLRYEDALNVYDEAINLDPNNVLAWLNKAKTYAGNQEFDSALSIVDHLIQKHPEYIDSFILKAFILDDLGRYEEASSFYTEALNIVDQKLINQPYNIGLYEQKIEIFKDMNDPKAVIGVCDVIAEIGTPAEVIDAKYEQTLAYKYLKDEESTIPLYNELIMDTQIYGYSSSFITDLYFERGLAHYSMNDYLNAREDFLMVLSLDPTEEMKLTINAIGFDNLINFIDSSIDQ